MPIFGIVLARIISLRFQAAAVVIGGMILIGIGFKTIRETMRGEEGAESVSFSSFRASLVAGLAISTDELAIGFPLGASGMPIVTVLTAIAAQALFVTALGIAIGNRVGSVLGRRASRYAAGAAGIAFSAVGLWLILEAVLAK